MTAMAPATTSMYGRRFCIDRRTTMTHRRTMTFRTAVLPSRSREDLTQSVQQHVHVTGETCAACRLRGVLVSESERYSISRYRLPEPAACTYEYNTFFTYYETASTYYVVYVLLRT